MPSWICPYQSGSLLRLSIRPGARRSAVHGLHGERLKLQIAAPPRDGEANQELVRFLSELLGVRKMDVEILRGSSGRSKDVIVALPVEKVLTLLSSLL